MKIAVLFGSFNPLTNAHVTALRTAVDAIGADKGFSLPLTASTLREKLLRSMTRFISRKSLRILPAKK